MANPNSSSSSNSTNQKSEWDKLANGETDPWEYSHLSTWSPFGHEINQASPTTPEEAEKAEAENRKKLKERGEKVEAASNIPPDTPPEPSWASLNDEWLEGEGTKPNPGEDIPPEWEGLNGQYLPNNEEAQGDVNDPDEGIPPEWEGLNGQYLPNNEEAPTEANNLGEGIPPEWEGLNGQYLPNNEEAPEEAMNQVEIGEIDIKSIEQEFSESKAERLKELKDQLDALRPELAELYARNRRLFVGSANRAKFKEVQKQYEELMNEYLRTKASESYENEKRRINKSLGENVQAYKDDIIAKLTEFAGGDLDNTEKTQEEIDAEKKRLVEEAEKKIVESYTKEIEASKDRINEQFLQDLIAQKGSLASETVDKLNNGTIFRKAVNKIINNKALKVVLVGAAATGLVLTGAGVVAGIAAGTASIGLSFTAGGVAAGAAKGALMGGLMSRQNAEKSAVNSFAEDKDIRSRLERIDILSQDSDTTNVAEYLMQQYSEANTADRSSNIKRTAISAGLGAAIGAFASGINVQRVETGNTPATPDSEIFGDVNTRPQVEPSVDVNGIYHREGAGAYEFFTNETHLFDSVDAIHDSGFWDIYTSVGQEYGLQLGQPGWTYPGPVETWPETARAVMNEALQRAAEKGVIEGVSVNVPQAPINTAVNTIAEKYTAHTLYNVLSNVLGTIVVPGAVGRVIGDRNNNRNRPEPTAPEAPELTPPEPTPEAPERPPEAPTEPEAPERPPEASAGPEASSGGPGERQPTYEELLEEARNLEQEAQEIREEAQELTTRQQARGQDLQARKEVLAERIRNYGADGLTRRR